VQDGCHSCPCILNRICICTCLHMFSLSSNTCMVNKKNSPAPLGSTEFATGALGTLLDASHLSSSCMDDIIKRDAYCFSFLPRFISKEISHVTSFFLSESRLKKTWRLKS
jgi:hypothetical protein